MGFNARAWSCLRLRSSAFAGGASPGGSWLQLLEAFISHETDSLQNRFAGVNAAPRLSSFVKLTHRQVRRCARHLGQDRSQLAHSCMRASWSAPV